MPSARQRSARLTSSLARRGARPSPWVRSSAGRRARGAPRRCRQLIPRAGRQALHWRCELTLETRSARQTLQQLHERGVLLADDARLVALARPGGLGDVPLRLATACLPQHGFHRRLCYSRLATTKFPGAGLLHQACKNKVSRNPRAIQKAPNRSRAARTLIPKGCHQTAHPHFVNAFRM